MKARTYNIKQIAEKTQVSIATISRALNSETRHKVAPEMLGRIEEALLKYPYTPNSAARNLRKSVYHTIGILFPHHEGILSSDYYSQILSGAADALLETDYSMKMILCKPQKSNWDRHDFHHGENVDGLVMTYWRTFFSRKDFFEQLGIPCVILNNVENNIKARFIAGDHFDGGRMAAQYLYGKGHRHIAVFMGKSFAPDVAARLAGFRSFFKEKNIPLGPESIFDVNFEAEKSYFMTDQVLAAKPAFTAVFCMNDVQAHGVLRRLKDLNIQCPKRLSVMGYDDDRNSTYSTPALTTIKPPVYQLARKAVEDLIKQLNQSDRKFYQPAYMPVSLIERSSVGMIE